MCEGIVCVPTHVVYKADEQGFSAIDAYSLLLLTLAP